MRCNMLVPIVFGHHFPGVGPDRRDASGRTARAWQRALWIRFRSGTDRPTARRRGRRGGERPDQRRGGMGLRSNGTALGAARRDKYVQIEAIRSAGLRATRQLLVTDAEQLAGWHRELGGWLVVKPIRSAAGDGVHF